MHLVIVSELVAALGLLRPVAVRRSVGGRRRLAALRRPMAPSRGPVASSRRPASTRVGDWGVACMVILVATVVASVPGRPVGRGAAGPWMSSGGVSVTAIGIAVG